MMYWSLIIATAVGIIAIWRPKFGVAALILLWPSYLLRLTVLHVPTTALELSIYAVTLGSLIHLWIHHAPFPRRRLPKTGLILYGLWSVGWIVATLFATNHQEALGALKAWWFDATLFGALLLWTSSKVDEQILFIQAALVSGLVVSLAGLVQLVAFRGTLQDGRLSSFFHPVANYAAMYLGPLFVLGAAALVWRVLRGWLWWAVVGIIGLALLLTVSFAGYLAAGIGMLLIWWFSPAGKTKRRLGWSTLVVVIAAAVIIPQTHFFTEHFKTTDRSSGLVRTQIWVTSWFLIQQHPLIGIGPNTFEPQYRLEVPKHYWPPLEWLVAQPHNLYLALWLETGLLGALSFVALLVWWIISTWRRATTLPETSRLILWAVVVAMIAILIHGLFDTPYFKNDAALEFIFLLLLPWLATNKEKIST